MGRVHLGQESLFLNSGSKAISSRNKGVGYVNQFFDRAVKKKIAQPESSSYFPSVAALSDGTIVAAFGFEGVRMADGTTTSALVRISPNMDFSDMTVNDANGFALNVKVDSQDRTIVSGSFPVFSRYSSSGVYDSSFSGNVASSVSVPWGGIQSFDLDPSGGIFYAAYQDMNNGSPADTFGRIHPNGLQDSTFYNRLQYNAGAAQNECRHVSASPLDGSVIVAGTFISVDGISVNNGVAKFHANGVRDTSFNPFPADPFPTVSATKVDLLTGSLYIAGDFSSIFISGAAGEHLVNGFARLHPNGAVDPSFPDVGISSGGYSSPYIRHIEPLPDGGVMIAGIFETAGNFITSVPVEDRRVNIAAFNSDGTPKKFNLNIKNDNLFLATSNVLQAVPIDSGSYLLSGYRMVEIDGIDTPLGFTKIWAKDL